MPRQKPPTLDEHKEAGKLLKQIRTMLINARTNNSMNKVFTKSELYRLSTAIRVIDDLKNMGDDAVINQYSATENTRELTHIYYGGE